MKRRPDDPPGTCHAVGCAGKGKHPPHPPGTGGTLRVAPLVRVTRADIGAPEPGSTAYDHPQLPAGRRVIADRSMLVRCDSLLSALLHGRVAGPIRPDDREEATILSGYLRRLEAEAARG